MDRRGARRDRAGRAQHRGSNTRRETESVRRDRAGRRSPVGSTGLFGPCRGVVTPVSHEGSPLRGGDVRHAAARRSSCRCRSGARSWGRCCRRSVDDKIFAKQRGWIYLEELWETAVLLVVLWVVAGMAGRGRTRAVHVALVAITFPRSVDPRASSADRCRSPAVPHEPEPAPGAVGHEPRGTRIADPLRNMPMRVGLAPIILLPDLEPAGRWDGLTRSRWSP